MICCLLWLVNIVMVQYYWWWLQVDIFLQWLQHYHIEYPIIYVILVLLEDWQFFWFVLFIFISTQLSNLSNSLNEKFDSLHKLLGESEGKIKANINNIVMRSLMSVKYSNIEALKAENLKLKFRVDSLEEKIIELDISRNKQGQYTRRNNTEI